MKNKKGFTLVELIAVIAILGLILTIAGISIVSIRKNVVAKQKENLQATIKIAAQGYYQETGVTSIPVGILLQIGAVQADSVDYTDSNLGIEKGDPVILDPVDGGAINCDTIDFDAEGNATYNEHNTCDAKVLADNALTMKLQLDNETPILYSTEYQDNNWIKPLKEDGTLKTIKFSSVVSNIKTGDTLKYTWTNPLNPDSSVTNDVFTLNVPDSGYIDESYNLYIELSDKSLSKDFKVKVDAKKPTIENIQVLEKDTWTTSKNITATLIDSESKLYGYKVVKGENVKCTDTDWITDIKDKEIADIQYSTKVNSKYYKICVKDNAGYITESSSYIVAENIDYNAPELTVSVSGGNTWKQSHTATITVTEKGPDGKYIVGFKNNSQVTFKYGWLKKTSAKCSELTNTGTINVGTSANSFSTTISVTGINTSFNGDGNFFVCPVEGGVQDAIDNTLTYASGDAIKAQMKLDGVNPSASFSISTRSGYSYNSNNAQYKVSNLSDNASGVYQMCITSGNQSNCSWVTAKNGTTNYTFSSSEGSGKTESLNFYLKDKAGNIYSTSASYTLYTYCDSTTSSTSCGSCNASCGDGSMYCTTYYSDTYIPTHSCGSNGGYESCYLQACPDPDPEPVYPPIPYPTCDITCQMQINSNKWWACTDDTCRQKLHEANEQLKEINPDCTPTCEFTPDGYWNVNGQHLYE